MPITVFIQSPDGKFQRKRYSGLEKTEGWYYSIIAADMDNDGDDDLIVGNLGLNYKYKATKDQPFQIHANDFDKNGAIDIILSYYENSNIFPVRGRSCSSQQLPSIGQKFKTFEAFGNSDLFEIYGEKLENALNLKAYTFASQYIENINGQSFKSHILPQLAQVSSINAILVNDYDGNQKKDILIAGNLFGSEIETPRNDSGVGLLLSGDGSGNFLPLSVLESGFFVPFNVKNIKSIETSFGPSIIVGCNNDSLRIFTKVN